MQARLREGLRSFPAQLPIRSACLTSDPKLRDAGVRSLSVDIGLINPPIVGHWVPPLPAHPFFRLGRIFLNPAVNGGMINAHTSLLQGRGS